MWENFKEAFNFTINNSQKVFTGIIVSMLIIYTFIKSFIKMVLDFIFYGKIIEERIDLDLFGLNLKLLSTNYDLVVMILITMVFMYFHRIIGYYILAKFGDKSEIKEIPSNTSIDSEDSNYDYSGNKK